MAMPAPGTRNLRNRLLGNETRAQLRRYVNRLPVFMQRLFPPSDIRRRIRMNPEDRDAIDPEWRVRAGKPAPTAADIARRSGFIHSEQRLAEDEALMMRWTPGILSIEDQINKYVRERTELAARSFDELIEDPAISHDIYINAANVDYREEEVSRRARIAFHGEVDPVGLVINYDDLPNLGAIRVPADTDDPVLIQPIQNGDRLLVITQDGFQHKFLWLEDDGISRWLLMNPNPTNPPTGRPVEIGQLSRATALVEAQAGGRRKKRQSRKHVARKIKQTRRRRSTRV